MDIKEIRISRIKKRMDEMGLSARELGKRAGVSESGISRILSGESDPRISTFKKMAIALRVDPTWLMGYGETKEGVSTDTPSDIIKYLEKYLTVPAEYFVLSAENKGIVDHLIKQLVEGQKERKGT